MPQQSNGSDLPSRVQRLEELIEVLTNRHINFEERHSAFEEEHKQLLTAQVLLTDEMRKLAESQRHTDERLNALIGVVDDLVRRQNPPQQ
jgi:FtsZ-binding cell division protein ZapB